jgi:AraC-like DNA-binding protein
MENHGQMMEKTGMVSRAPEETALLSSQVAEGRYFFLELAAPTRGAREVVLAFGGREVCRPDYRVKRESFGYHGLEFVAEGAGSVSIDGRVRPLAPGAVYAYAPDSHLEIATDAARPLVKYFACWTGRGIAGRLARARVPVGACMRLAAAGEMQSVFEDLIREGQWHGPLTREVCAVLGELLLLKLEAAAIARVGDEPARASFLRCKSLIDANADRFLSLEDIAEAAGCDVSTICRLFRRFQGTSPYQYLLRRKMNFAAEFLMESGGLVKEAAQRVGFADPYHFSRVFKAVHGVAPRELRDGPT